MKPVILVDASCDMPLEFIEKNHIPHLGLICHIDDKEYEDDFGKTFTYDEFYGELRKGKMPTTSQINSFRFEEKFREYAKQGIPVIYLAMSSALSGTYNSAVMARETILGEYKDADITVIDTKGSSIGEGLLVYYAYDMLNKGYSKDSIITWVKENMLKMNYWFAVSDLDHLKRGGRISSSAAVVGSILNINPILCISSDGSLAQVTNIRGRRKAIKYLTDKFKAEVTEPQNTIVAISHGDCIEEAEYLKNIMEEEFHVKKVIVNKLGLIMGSHCGQGMLSLCFLGNENRK
ncbi:DegV family protein [Clostridium sp. JN-9]|uniref:DegV family protein n=1 Tax=Clostridium sp. JN-9 TaxID=2507159 RepID=UPI000FFDFC4F|nr:DegV family protein [Clostridium sp. JN-9]QAT40089.1 DegV family protein [Clostridium sp. JN-9]